MLRQGWVEAVGIEGKGDFGGAGVGMAFGGWRDWRQSEGSTTAKIAYVGWLDIVAGSTVQFSNWRVSVLRTGKNEPIVVSALRARASFGELLRRVEDECRSLVIEKRGTPKAVLLSIRDYVRLAAPEPEVLRVIGEESQRKGTDKLTSRQIDQVIKAARARKSKRG